MCYHFLQHQLQFIFLFTDFTCVAGVKSFANGRMMSDTTNIENCENRGYGRGYECYQVSMETSMKAGGFQSTYS